LDDKKPKVFPNTNCKKQLETQKVKVQCGPKYSQNVKKIALHQGLDHFNSPQVPHNGCKEAIKDTNPNENKVLKNESWIIFKNSYTLKEPLPNLVTIGGLKSLLPNSISI